MGNKLKLRAEDSDDIAVFSAYLQDAVTLVGDLAWQPQHHRFAAMFNRFIWEDSCKTPEKDTKQHCQRIRTGVHFDGVLAVSSHDLPKDNKDFILELLAIDVQETDDEHHNITLIFAGGPSLRLKTEQIDAQMRDIGDPWPAKCHPRHEIFEEWLQE